MAWLLVLLLLYWVPTVIAVFRGHQVAGVILLNLFLGWTIIGWCLAIVLACGAEKPQRVIVVHQAAAGLDHAATPLPTEGESGYGGYKVDVRSWGE